MIARSTKDELQDRWHEIFSNSDSEFLDVANEIVNYFEKLNDPFWNEKICERIAHKFPLSSVKQMEQSEQHLMALKVLKSLEKLSSRILKRLACLCGIVFENDDKKQIQLNPVVKYLNRISFEEGLAIARLAMESMKTNIEKSEELFEQSSMKFKECLRNKPNDVRALSNLALILTIRARLQSLKQQLYQQKTPSTTTTTTTTEPRTNFPKDNFSSLELLKNASDLYEKLINSIGNSTTGDNRVLLQYAHNLLEQYKLLKESKDCESLLQNACQCFEKAISMGKGKLNAGSDFQTK